MADGLTIGKGQNDLVLLPRMANRHGLIAGATESLRGPSPALTPPGPALHQPEEPS